MNQNIHDGNTCCSDVDTAVRASCGSFTMKWHTNVTESCALQKDSSMGLINTPTPPERHIEADRNTDLMTTRTEKIILRVHFEQYFTDLAPHEIVNTIKKICKRMRHTVKTRRLQFHKGGRKYKRYLLKQATFLCVRSGNDENDSCLYYLSVQKYPIDCGYQSSSKRGESQFANIVFKFE